MTPYFPLQSHFPSALRHYQVYEKMTKQSRFRYLIEANLRTKTPLEQIAKPTQNLPANLRCRFLHQVLLVDDCSMQLDCSQMDLF